MMDPLGHGAGAGIGPATTRAVMWATTARRAAWMKAELTEAGLSVLRATSFRHVQASLVGEGALACALAAIDFAAVTPAELAVLVSARWAGYRGAIIAVAGPAGVEPDVRAIVHLEAVVEPIAHGLRDAVARWRGAPARVGGMQPR